MYYDKILQRREKRNSSPRRKGSVKFWLSKEFAMVFGTPVDIFTRIKCKGFTLCQYLQYARKYVPLQLFKLIMGFLNVHLQMWKQAYFSKVCPEVPGPSSWRTTAPGHHLSPLLYRMVWESQYKFRHLSTLLLEILTQWARAENLVLTRPSSHSDGL